MRPFLSSTRAGGLALSLALVMVACGEDEQSAPAPAPTPPAASKAPAQVPSPPRAKRKIDTPAITKKQAEKRRKRLQKERRRLTQRLANATVELLELEGANVAVDRRARKVSIALGSEAACKAKSDTGERLEVAIKHALVFVKTVEVTADGERSLESYRSAQCRRGRTPARREVVVLQLAGKGPERTALFAIKSDQWTVDFDPSEPMFVIQVFRGNRLVRQIGSKTGKPGERTLPGPGTFRLAVKAKRDWKLTVRDGP